MINDDQNLRTRIAGHLAGQAGQTTDEIAVAIGADYRETQNEVCRMYLADLVVHDGMREVPGLGRRPVWALVETKERT